MTERGELAADLAADTPVGARDKGGCRHGVHCPGSDNRYTKALSGVDRRCTGWTVVLDQTIGLTWGSVTSGLVTTGALVTSPFVTRGIAGDDRGVTARCDGV
ncbi:hypothetical protein GCM10029964_099120 [Kibdelosporangium lantanae]